jgi:hypothetical protein
VLLLFNPDTLFLFLLRKLELIFIILNSVKFTTVKKQIFKIKELAYQEQSDSFR